MNTWRDTQFQLPTTVTIDGEEHKIRSGCDYRMVLDCFAALTDERMHPEARIASALFIFYEDLGRIKNHAAAAEQMRRVMNCGQSSGGGRDSGRIMDWNHDFQLIAAPVSRILGYDVREPRVTHWWTFVSAYMEIGECAFSTVVAIRKKKSRGKKLEKWEREFADNNPDLVNLPSVETENNLKMLMNMEQREGERLG